MDQQKHKSTLTVALVVQLACLGAFNYGYIIAELTIATYQLAIQFGIDLYDTNEVHESQSPSDYNSSYVTFSTISTVAMPIGAMVSSYASKFIMNKMGRRQFMMISDAIIVLGSMISLISSMYAFIIARFILGLGSGMNTAVVSLFIKEVSPNSLSGLTGSFFQINVNIGIIAVNLVSLSLYQVTSNATPVQAIWRLIVVLPSVCAVLRLVGFLFFFKHDTPFYYFSNGRIEEGNEALRQIYKEEFIDEIRESMTVDGGDEGSVSDESTAQKNDETKTYSYKKRLMVGILLQFFQQMTGINTVVQFAGGIFANITSNYNTINYLVLSSNIFLMFAAFLGSSLSVKFGRKSILQFGHLSCAILMITFGIIAFFDVKASLALQISSIIIVFIYYGCFNCSLGPVTWIITSDILKEQGMSYSVVSNWFGNIISTVMAQNQIISINFLIFGGFCSAAFLFLVKFTKETKDKTYREIQQLYSNGQDDKQQLLDD